MKCYCTKCKINWSVLLTCDINDHEQTEVCPVCLTDTYLEDGKAGPVYFMCAFSAKVLNVETKQELNLSPVYIPRSVKAKPAWTETKAEHERRELKGILAYRQSGNPEDYFKAFHL